jgi:hypothetical protein
VLEQLVREPADAMGGRRVPPDLKGSVHGLDGPFPQGGGGIKVSVDHYGGRVYYGSPEKKHTNALKVCQICQTAVSRGKMSG